MRIKFIAGLLIFIIIISVSGSMASSHDVDDEKKIYDNTFHWWQNDSLGSLTRGDFIQEMHEKRLIFKTQKSQRSVLDMHRRSSQKDNTSSNLENSHPISPNGSILYVGGNGPGNYSRIQDAIDNASDFDTIFVYDDGSPYHEELVISKHITLFGENKETTIIDGQFTNKKDLILVNTTGVCVRGFTLTHCRWYPAAIHIISNDSLITDNIINYCDGDAIYLGEIYGIKHPTNNTIVNNYFYQNFNSIDSDNSFNDTILRNIFDRNGQEIFHTNIMRLYHSRYHNISNNIFYNTSLILKISDSNILSENYFEEAALVLSGSFNHIVNNTFVNYGVDTSSFDNDLRNNTVNGKSLIFLKGVSDLTIEDAGQILLYRCNRTTIQHVTLRNLGTAIHLIDCNQCCIQANTITGCTIGMLIQECRSSDINNNLLFNNYGGIGLISSPFSAIHDNKIQSPSVIGDIGIGVSSSFVKVYSNTVEYFIEGILVQKFFNVVEKNICRWNILAGVHVQFCFFTTVKSNQFEHNGESDSFLSDTGAIIVTYSVFTSIRKNNCILNLNDAFFANVLGTYWINNYWNETLRLPKMIFGVYYTGSFSNIPILTIPLVDFDLSPAKKPNAI
jgi:parallel beta-helix repeat protein